MPKKVKDCAKKREMLNAWPSRARFIHHGKIVEDVLLSYGIRSFNLALFSEKYPKVIPPVSVKIALRPHWYCVFLSCYKVKLAPTSWRY